MLRPRRRTALIAAASVFAALYAVLGTFPISKLLLGQGYFLTASNLVTPLGGMLFGPVIGALSALIGDVVDSYTGYVSFAGTGLAIVAADLSVATTAGLAFAGKRVAALGLPLLVLVLYSADPLSVLFVGPVPFAWLHMISFAMLVPLLVLERRGRISRLSPTFVTGVTFAALMCGQLTGTLVGQNLAVRVYGVLTPDGWRALVPEFFPLYPVERIFFTAVSSLVSIPVLRAISQRHRGGSNG